MDELWFRHIARREGISCYPNMSARMLTERFKELEAHGIVQRTVYPETPVRIEYDSQKKDKN